jgi:hypothetical protein
MSEIALLKDGKVTSPNPPFSMLGYNRKELLSVYFCIHFLGVFIPI